jgi:hypothetical protein
LALLAFLAVTMGMGVRDRSDARRGIVLDEANSIGTTYLRAGYLPERRRAIRAAARVRPVAVVVTDAKAAKLAVDIQRSWRPTRWTIRGHR